MKYNPFEIEIKWQKYWSENKTFGAKNQSDKPKYYVLDMFPYPSGAGLHVGHPLGYIASDIYSRFKRHQGFNVLHPMGYDSFGLPAEQYAIQTGQRPEDTTSVNIDGGIDKEGNQIAGYRKQLDKIGFSFDWDREVRTSNPDYYKHTQWIFIQLFNSWYNKKSNKAEDISALISIFEKEGNQSIEAACNDDLAYFSAKQWNKFDKEEKEKILLQYRLAYLSETEVNWCPELGTVLANDEVINGVSERGGFPIVRKKMTQWSMRISAYTERLLQGLEQINWSESIKESQRNWIGKSTGALITFRLQNSENLISVFTTRPDTIFGVTFITLAPEHELVSQITTPEQKKVIEDYINQTAKRSERERMSDVKTISGVFTGAYAEHPFTKEAIPVWIGDYVLANYGTGAVMAVPCGDDRDFAFANFFKNQKGMPEIKNIFNGIDVSKTAFILKDNFVLKNSGFLNNLNYKEATETIINELEKAEYGKRKINYRLRDAVFSRQRYWGEPFPVYYVNGLPQIISGKHLPIVLPEVKEYLPTEDGLPPLGNAIIWAWDTKNNKIVSTDLIDNTTIFPLELNTMPGWAGSSWYWMRYMDPKNENEFAGKEPLKYWENVDLYIGGSEHATGHLLYSRFWNKFLKDKGFAPTEEPFKKLINQGMILGTSAFVYRLKNKNIFVSKNKLNEQDVQAIRIDINFVNSSDELDIEKFKKSREEYANIDFILEDNNKYIVGREVEKMSKSKYNVVTPDDICNEFGADTLRLYEMFLGPLEQSKPWNTAGISGVFGFLKKLWRLYFDENGLIVVDEKPNAENLKSLHKTIKKVTEDIESFSFNTSVSQFMICVNELSAQNCHCRSVLEPLAIIISPYAPHITEEIWEKLGHQSSISDVPFPIYEPKYLIESSKQYPVSFNGKMRFTIELSLDLTKEQIEEIITKDPRTLHHLNGINPNKVVIVPGKVINFVI